MLQEDYRARIPACEGKWGEGLMRCHGRRRRKTGETGKSEGGRGAGAGAAFQRKTRKQTPDQRCIHLLHLPSSLSHHTKKKQRRRKRRRRRRREEEEDEEEEAGEAHDGPQSAWGGSGERLSTPKSTPCWVCRTTGAARGPTRSPPLMLMLMLLMLSLL